MTITIHVAKWLAWTLGIGGGILLVFLAGVGVIALYYLTQFKGYHG